MKAWPKSASTDNRVDPGRKPGHEARDGDDEQRIEAGDEADDHDENAGQDKHRR